MKKRKSITQLATELRNNRTEAEKKLWEVLRKRRLGDFRFLRQKPIIFWQTNYKKYFFIADFYCSEKKLVKELDGKIHDYPKDYNYNRDLVLNGLGLKVL